MSQDLIDLLREAGYEPRSYSGRSMYGDECLSVTCADPIEVIIEVASNLLVDLDNGMVDIAGAKEILKTMQNYRTDSMGLRQVIYWPRVKYEDTDDEMNSWIWGDNDDPVGDTTPDTDDYERY